MILLLLLLLNLGVLFLLIQIVYKDKFFYKDIKKLAFFLGLLSIIVMCSYFYWYKS